MNIVVAVSGSIQDTVMMNIISTTMPVIIF